MTYTARSKTKHTLKIIAGPSSRSRIWESYFSYSDREHFAFPEVLAFAIETENGKELRFELVALSIETHIDTMNLSACFCKDLNGVERSMRDHRNRASDKYVFMIDDYNPRRGSGNIRIPEAYRDTDALIARLNSGEKIPGITLLE